MLPSIVRMLEHRTETAAPAASCEAGTANLPSSSLASTMSEVPAQAAPETSSSCGLPKAAEDPGDIRVGADIFADPPNFRVAARSGQELESLRLPKLPWSPKLPRSLLGQGRGEQVEGVDSEDIPVRPDGKVRLRVFDGTCESHTLAVELPCTILGSSLKSAHIADGTHASVKTEHVALIFVPPESYLLQPLNGEVSLSSASQHAAVSCTLLRERRSAPQCKAPSKLLSVGSTPEDITRQHCCFQLAKSDIVFFVDLLPSAASVRALGTARHLLQAFVDGKTSDAKQRRLKELKQKPRAATLVPASEAEGADSKPLDAPPPSPLKMVRSSEVGVRRSPSVWRHDRLQRSASADPSTCMQGRLLRQN